jgi:murein L,D-transpeptidase YcbB/YkuD
VDIKMNIKKLQAKKNVFTKTIFDLIKGFQKETGLQVTQIINNQTEDDFDQNLFNRWMLDIKIELK